ncbi:MAG: TerD family protein [Clostridia bacterium]|nr:TerD family protein [Clostridia bacterium]
MSVNLTKGQGVNLKKEAPNLRRLMIGLGWDPVKSFLGRAIDIDASVICIDEKGKFLDVVYYGNLTHRSGAIKHMGDNLTGEGDGDDEQITIDLERLPANIAKCSIIINIYSAYSRNQHFGKVRNCFVHADDMDTRKELVRYNVDGNFDGLTGIFVADVYRYNGEWRFKAIGEGVKVADIKEMVNMKCKR